MCCTLLSPTIDQKESIVVDGIYGCLRKNRASELREHELTVREYFSDSHDYASSLENRNVSSFAITRYITSD